VTTSTRRLLLAALVIVGLTLPAEVVLLRALSTSSDAQAAEQWVADLGDSELTEAGLEVRGYSYPYRREIMRRASPEQRVRFWTAHIRAYEKAHPELDLEAREALANAVSALTPDALSEPTRETQDALQVAAERIEKALGRDEAGYLLVWLGPTNTKFLGSLDPLVQRLASVVRQTFVASALEEQPCDCAPSWGCSDAYQWCGSPPSCRTDASWPKCGWWWSEDCTALCLVNE
jgi:hypothetical protein